MRKHAIISLILLVFFGLIGWYFLFNQSVQGARYPFRYGLDLVGGTELVYTADTSKVDDASGAMETLKEVIERRVNIFGVSEPLVQVERAGLISGNPTNRLIVELPGYKDVEEAKNSLGKTPVLEFRLAKPGFEEIAANNPQATVDELFAPTDLTGRYLSRARVEFNPTTGEAVVGIEFNADGKNLFAKITRENKGEVLAIILDGSAISIPIIQDEISDGKAQITGAFTPEEAKDLVRNLNYGALPVPIEFSGSQLIGATLGEAALDAGVRAGLIGFAALSLFLVLWYRLPGFVSVVALVSYIILSLAIFKLIPVTLSAAGVAGFILSIGMAVDANVLIFERTKEELKNGKNIPNALHEGFHRAWLSIRDSNTSSIITAIVLFWLGTSAVKGFALTLGIGVLVSMFTALTLSRTFLFAIAPKSDSGFKRFLFSNGFHIK
ncbi:MAG: protein-export membrane protein SecD [Candidatus Zambryskibacteria bacterium RIFCSPHIGHO2_12_FULL_48_10]|uniref:Protein translocase subunit SecD n=1 Tax=Candidatus Zambryskibacteria bacterium RIFCSPHIGHO2_01_FULL_46_25 TaxID=1802738 RepID=A0A1G2T1P4_9BACT|nr:MAG: Preprotein translocase subunit SecD [Parcubacteria group bacterium GW2011_GWB1_48_6]OHA90749.1 MAG: protein-export membrane protein SecD [Candidatus Zambryskibacteria bacterium RIFCSPHIGHO2_01_FULL_46_25]OHB02123.1 MAG: protein-export membrane protein SecD [Candidatus Zambryskibacteria bacterium RIFCSPHIGHO2_12_FULL_48_10]OHB07219.1 MAG: protein-export membrane protein SecD [Candidatus Zambryskibacteria bacterium RIFCSPLOWO2_01_FULL_48_25]